MPTDLKCPHCDLRVSIGGYFIKPGKGFSGATLVPCGACGTQHVVKHGIRDNGPEYFDIQKVVVDSFEPSGLDRVVVRIQKFHKPRPALRDALAIARSAPFTLVESLSADQASKLVEELKRIDVRAHRDHGPGAEPVLWSVAAEQHRVSRPAPARGCPTPWLEKSEPASAEVSTMRCMVCHSSGTMVQTVPAVLACPSCR